MGPLFPGVPGLPFPCNMAPGKEKNIAGGTGGQKNWAIIFPGTPGYPFRGERGAVFPKKYRLGIWRKKSGRNVVPWFSGKYQVHVCHETWIVLYFGKLKFTIFYS